MSRAFKARLQEHPTAIAWMCGAAYLAASLFEASRKPLWFDELFSLYLSRLPIGDLWRALSTGMEQTPPLFYLVTRLSLALVPVPEVGLRVPEILATSWGAGCVYLYLRKRLNPAWARAGIVLYSLSSLYTQYRLEGRSYALCAASFATALVLWQRREEGQRTGAVRSGQWIGLALVLGLGIALHYYAVFLLVPFAVAAIAPVVSGQRADRGLLGATALAMLALVPCIPLLVGAARATVRFWSRPTFFALHAYYVDLYLEMAGPVVVAVLGLALFGKRPAVSTPPAPLAAESALLLASFGLPVLMVASTLITTGAFAPRYAAASIPAGVILAIVAVARMSDGGTAGATMIVAAGLALFAARQVSALAGRGGTVRGAIPPATLSQPMPANIPIVVSNPLSFLYLQHYARVSRERLLFAMDLSVGTDRLPSAERSLKLLGQFVPLRIEDLHEFVARRTPFLLVTDTGHAVLPQLARAAPVELREFGTWGEVIVYEASFRRVDESP